MGFTMTATTAATTAEDSKICGGSAKCTGQQINERQREKQRGTESKMQKYTRDKNRIC